MSTVNGLMEILVIGETGAFTVGVLAGFFLFHCRDHCRKCCDRPDVKS